MQRLKVQMRPQWQSRCEEVGFDWHSLDDETYWNEGVCYELSSEEVDQIAIAVAHIQERYIEATEHVISNRMYETLRIQPEFFDLAVRSWEADEPSIYGRFDLAVNGVDPPRLLEYNADTPTSLMEAAVVQWLWLEETSPGFDQFNSIHEKLIDALRYLLRIAPNLQDTFYFSCIQDSAEDLGNVSYLEDVARQAGWRTARLFVDEIGYDEIQRVFVDLEDQAIYHWFKLYPWEFIRTDPFGRKLLDAPLRIVEPAWKMLWSNKAMLAILHDLFPEDPYILPTSLSEKRFEKGTVRKPIYGREGSNVTIAAQGSSYSTGGNYGTEGWVWQQFAPLPDFEGNRPVIGAWVIGGEPAGIGIRESNGPITDNLSRFVPHRFLPSKKKSS
jgi:glutathionylspermidine synthase